ncbi:hypothetical protein ACK1YF_003712 [Salmonella enterica]|nr:Rha family transcriptional regulator [Salmonella enterica]EKT1306508.1 Rha family transcriptional regulator [Salmonella enterica]EKT1311339.1 Rha family transcriptional regulator [Salmonella enterica]EKT3010395.1 Rha family transcriptional regulator [Salmonella enterica]EKT3112305.1 Rha family transcriptional regulator [Salmonella enterica]
MKNMINSEPSMTSSEIAELAEKRHDNVKRTIEKLAEQGIIVRPQIEDEQGTDAFGRKRVTQTYRFEGEQGKRDSIVVIAQLCPYVTARLVDRWRELEALLVDKNSPPEIHSQSVDIVALACAVAETTVTTAIKAAIEAATVQQEKLASQRRDSDDSVVFDYPSTNSEVDNSAFQPIHALSAKSGLADSACRRLIEFAHVPARKIGRSGLHADSDAFVAAACKLIGESVPPKGKIKRWQHHEFGGFMLRRALPESGQEKQD